MKVSLVNPKTQKVRMFKMGVSWMFLIFVVLFMLPGFFIMLKGTGLIAGAIFIWLAVKGNRMQVKQLVKKGWTPTTDVDKTLLVREGLLKA